MRLDVDWLSLSAAPTDAVSIVQPNQGLAQLMNGPMRIERTSRQVQIILRTMA